MGVDRVARQSGEQCADSGRDAGGTKPAVGVGALVIHLFAREAHRVGVVVEYDERDRHVVLDGRVDLESVRVERAVAGDHERAAAPRERGTDRGAEGVAHPAHSERHHEPACTRDRKVMHHSGARVPGVREHVGAVGQRRGERCHRIRVAQARRARSRYVDRSRIAMRDGYR